MKATRLLAGAAAAAAVALATAAPAQADLDTDFATELHGYGIYGQRDYNAWIAKLTCKRLNNGVDVDLLDSVRFVGLNMAKDTTQEQSWQFLGSALKFYCPDKLPLLQNVGR
ncbi:DUF732 domain-containing protein [Mycobacterium sp. PS03-16]|uniref:DUF732 domain-containing protein n=1 Tax=Mycobacterium sp. PS03-16 TaxID=2559611 RepID=UPI0010731685|nr:DUF732 domain-containing protein [Mycobacterium sp. PS03-16]TFV55789.1 DUF732 domain-containing protein [Mycobacterium sp. PS03-16]